MAFSRDPDLHIVVLLFSGVPGGSDESEDRLQQRPQIRVRGRRVRRRRAAAAAQRQEEGLLDAGREGGAAAGRRPRLRRYGAGRPEEAAAIGGGGGSVSGREGGAAVLAALPGDGAAARGAVDVLVQSIPMAKSCGTQ